MKRVLKFVFISFFVLACCIALGACILLKQPKFGEAPMGAKLDRIEKSANLK